MNFGLKPGERLAVGAVVYVEEWCDGQGNLGPCSCSGTGHWRLGRTIPLDEILRHAATASAEAARLRQVVAAQGAQLAAMAEPPAEERGISAEMAAAVALTERDALRVEVEALRLALDGAETCIQAEQEYQARLKADIGALLRETAEDQREACAVYIRGPEDLATMMDRANAGCIRATPLVTDRNENP